jgi:hypothetical protein
MFIGVGWSDPPPKQSNSCVSRSFSRILLEKLMVAQLIKKFLAFSGTRRPITIIQKSSTLAPILRQMNPTHTIFL